MFAWRSDGSTGTGPRTRARRLHSALYPGRACSPDAPSAGREAARLVSLGPVLARVTFPRRLTLHPNFELAGFRQARTRC
jgi:hypothetical protein